MNPNIENAESIFTAARDIADPVQRRDFVASSCAAEPALRHKVQALLDAFDAAGEFLSEPKGTSASGGGVCGTPATPASVSSVSPGDDIGSVIGPYKLLQVIGEGGFGTVFMAEQAFPVRRRVAFKIVKLGMDTRQVVARFEQERQALAMMSHPHIAKVFDAGATGLGRPYFVMELCTGDPITEYCDHKSLTVEERLRLFVQVCQAVQHAHQKGVIHRDIKPSNILVSTQDGVPYVKVIDFGIAKATSSRLTEKTLFTEHKQFIGTPQYMSPEQAEGSLDIDTRTDVYSLGVLLYELLTGVTPFDPRQLRAEAYEQMQRIIREVDPPPPSTRVSRRGADSAAVAASRRVEAGRLCTLIRGELDWIVMKALEKNRQRRYETANGLAMDVECFLAKEQVLAAPASVLYRAKSFLRRHRAAVITASVVILALLVGLGLSIAGFVQARLASDRAESAQLAEASARGVAEAQRARADLQSERLRQELYISQISRVQSIIENGGAEAVKPILESCDPGLRGWEWHRLSLLADRSDHTLRAHQSTNYYLAGIAEYSPDGRRFLTFGDRSVLRVWDAESFQMLLEIKLPDNTEVMAASWSSDGAAIAIGAHPQVVCVYDSTGGKELHRCTPTADAGFVRSVAMNPSGTLLAYGTWFGPTTIADLRTGKTIQELGGSLGRAEALRFTADGARLVIGSLGNDVSIVDTGAWKRLFTQRGAGFVVLDGALSHDQRKVATVGEDGRLWVRDAESGRLIYAVSSGKSGASCVAFDPADNYIAVGGPEGLAFFDATNGERLGSLTGHDNRVIGLSFHPQGRYLLTMDVAGVVKRWHLGARQAVSTYVGTMDMTDAVFSNDSAVVYLGTYDDGIRALDARTLEVLNPGTMPIVAVWRVAVSPDGAWVAATGSDAKWGIPGKSIAVLCDRTGRVRQQWASSVGLTVFTADSRLVGTFDEGDLLTLRDAQTAQVLRKCPMPKERVCVIAGADRSELIVGCSDGVIRVISIETGAVTRTLPAHERAIDFCHLNSAGDTLVSYSGVEGVCKVWDWNRGIMSTRVDGIGRTTAIAVSPDGKRLVAGSSMGGFPVWDLSTGRKIISLGQVSGQTLAAAFSPDGGTIASCGTDHALRLWETKPPAAVELERRYQRDIERWANRRGLVWEVKSPESP
ncbi:MAG: protein kinase [Planctomycetes bacterium]|nr:protein kinase [Planctomycetota bacterium]